MAGSTLESEKVVLELARDDSAPAVARQGLEGALQGFEDERGYYARLLVSELVSNSVKYGGDGPVRVEIVPTAAGVHVEVIDCGPGFTAAPRDADSDRVGGWGLVLVDQLATRWGKQPGRCCVWFEIDR
jgi:anti-sigma regulatory factor (Ser/Thr protein kinase)